MAATDVGYRNRLDRRVGPEDQISGNVFADIGVPNASVHALKADLVIGFMKIMIEQGLNQTEATKCIGMSQGDLSKILRGKYVVASLTRIPLDRIRVAE